MLFESALNQRPLRKKAKVATPVAPAAPAVTKKEAMAPAPAPAPVSPETESKPASKKD